MAFQIVRTVFFSLCLVISCSICAIGLSQDEARVDSESTQQNKSAISGDQKAEPGQYRKEVEPGVVIFGVASRFAEVGTSTSFDSSPDGRTLVFGTGKLKFFDLKENKVTDTIGENTEQYQQVSYSPDGRFVFASAQGHGKSFVRVFDAIDKSSAGTITTTTPDNPGQNHFYMQSMAVSADAKFVACCSHNQVQVRDVGSDELVYHAKDLGYVQSVAFTPDEKSVVYSKSNRIVVVDLETGEERKRSDFSMVGQSASAVGINLARNLAVIPQGTHLHIYDLSDQEKDPISIKMPKQSYAQSADFSDDGMMVAASMWQQDGTNSQMVLVIVDVDKKKVVQTLPISNQGNMKFRFSPGNKSLFVSGHGINGVKEVPIADDSGLVQSKHPNGPANLLAMHPDGKAFLTCSRGGEVSWFNVETGDVDRSLQKNNIHSMQFSEDGSDVLISTKWGNSDGIARHSFATGKKKKAYSSKTVPKQSNIFSQIRKFMVGGGGNRVHSQQYSLGANYSTDKTTIESLAMEQTYEMVSEDGMGMSYSSQQRKTKIRYFKFDAETGKRLASQEIPLADFGFQESFWVQHSCVSPNGDQLAIGNNSQKVFVIDTETGEELQSIELGSGQHLNTMNYSATGKFLVLTSHIGAIIYNTDNGEEVYSTTERGTPIVSFSDDDSRVLIAHRNRQSEVKILDTNSWKTVFSRKSENTRTGGVLAGDGQTVLLGLADCRVEMWDLRKISR